MRIADLRAGLGDIGKIMDSFGAKKQASELQALMDVLAEFDELTLPELVKRIKSASVAPKKKEPAALNEAAVDEVLAKLQASIHMSEAFDASVDAVLKDKRLKQGELREIARRFGGSEPDKTSKAAIATFLKDRRLEMKRQGGLATTIDRMFGRG